MGRIWRASNHAGMALFVFLALTGVFLWRTGSLHFGLAAPAANEGEGVDPHAGHDHGAEESCPSEGNAPDPHAGHDHGAGESCASEGNAPAAAEWCAEHAVPEALCTRCNPDLIADLKKKGDWCAEHTLPESQCELCNPGCLKAIKEAFDKAAQQGHEGHDHAEHDADAHEGHDDGFGEEGGAWCIEHGVPEDVCTRCNADLIAAFKKKGDWCAEHSLPESHCEACTPGCTTKLGKGGAKATFDPSALAKRQCEHKLPILECNDCRYEVGAVKVRPSVAKALLTTAKVERRKASATLRLTGEVQLDQTRVVDVPPTASGRVLRVNAFLGQQVKRGDVLAVIHSGDFGEAKAAYLTASIQDEIARKEQERQSGVTGALQKLLARLERDTAESSESLKTPRKNPADGLVGEWKSKLLGSASRLRRARVVHAREKDLLEKGVSSKADHEAAHQEWEAAEADYAALVEEVRLNLSLDKLRADNAVRRADATLNAAEQRLHIFGLDHAAVQALGQSKSNGDFAQLEAKAPRSGTLTAQTVSMGKFVETTQSLYTIADLSNLWVWCDVYERDFAKLHTRLAEGKPLKVALRVAAFGDTAFEGVLDHVGSAVDTRTRTIKVRVQVANPEGKLKPGMFAQVEVTLAVTTRAAMVPRSAVLTDAGTAFVFQQWKDDLWFRRDIVAGDTVGDLVVVDSGLEEGATIAATGGFMLKSDVLRNKMGAG